MSLQLPPEIKMRKEPFGSSWKYVFRHDKLGDLGQIVVQGQPNGETKFTTEIAGGESDPMFNQRVDLFLPLSKKVMEFVQAQLGKNSRDAKAKPTGANSKHIIPSKIMTCSTCNQPTAFLIFSNQSENEGDLEDAARVMYHKIQNLNVPTWVIGEILGHGNPLNNSTIIKKVWPQRERMFEASPNTFNAMLDSLDQRHCT